MFTCRLQHDLGTTLSLVVLSFIVTVAMKMVAAVAASFATQYLTMMALDAGDSPGVNTMALQQGGLGVFLTVLILSVPPMASSFFQGALGNFMHYSAFGANAAPAKPETTGSPAPPQQPRLPDQSQGGRHDGEQKLPSYLPSQPPTQNTTNSNPGE